MSANLILNQGINTDQPLTRVNADGTSLKKKKKVRNIEIIIYLCYFIFYFIFSHLFCKQANCLLANLMTATYFSP